MTLVERKIHGSRMLLDNHDPGLSLELLKRGTRESEAPKILAKIMKPGMVAFDIGANLGFYALIEARAGAKVYAIEPNPKNAAILRQNVELNGYDIRVIERAAGNKTGASRFMQHQKSNRGFMVDMKAHRPGGIKKITVREEPLDAIARRYRLERVDLLRFDVDGYEVEMLQGAQGVLGLMPPGSWIFAELHPRCFTNPVRELQPTLENLIDHGFEPRHAVGPAKALANTKARDFPRAVCVDFASTAPLVFLEKCASGT